MHASITEIDAQVNMKYTKMEMKMIQGKDKTCRTKYKKQIQKRRVKRETRKAEMTEKLESMYRDDPVLKKKEWAGIGKVEKQLTIKILYTRGESKILKKKSH